MQCPAIWRRRLRAALLLLLQILQRADGDGLGTWREPVLATGVKPAGNCPTGEYERDWDANRHSYSDIKRFDSTAGKALVCEACPGGYYGDAAMADQCTACPFDYYARDSGSLKCKPCVQGALTEHKGSKHCLEGCIKGKYRPEGSHDEKCHDCHPNTYANIVWSTECKQCPLGKFSGGFGSASCPTCEQQPCMCDFLALEKNKKFVAVDQPDANLKIDKCHLWRKTDSLEFNLPVYKCDDGPFRLYYSRVYRRWVVSATMHKPPYHLYAATCVGMQQPRHCPASTSPNVTAKAPASLHQPGGVVLSESDVANVYFRCTTITPAPTKAPTKGVDCEAIYVRGAKPAESGGLCVGKFTRTVRDEAQRAVYMGKCGKQPVFMYFFKGISSWVISAALNTGPLIMTANSTALRPNAIRKGAWRQVLRGLPFGIPSSITMDCSAVPPTPAPTKVPGEATSFLSEDLPQGSWNKGFPGGKEPKWFGKVWKKTFKYTQGEGGGAMVYNCGLPRQWEKNCLAEKKCCVSMKCIPCSDLHAGIISHVQRLGARGQRAEP